MSTTINLFLVESEAVSKLKESFSKEEKESSRFLFREQNLDSDSIARISSIPFIKVQVTSSTTMLDLIKIIKGSAFYTEKSVIAVTKYAYIIDRPTISVFSDFCGTDEGTWHKFLSIVLGKSDIQKKIEKYHNTPVVDLGIVDNEILLVKSIEVWNQLLVEVMRCIRFPPTLIDFLHLVNDSVVKSNSDLQVALLYTEADTELSYFMRQSFSDLHILSGSNFRVYAIEKLCNYENLTEAIHFWKSMLSERLYVLWSALGWLSTKPYDKAQAYKIGEILGVKPSQFPCAVLFDAPDPSRAMIFPIIKPYANFFRSLFTDLDEILGSVEQELGKSRKELLKEQLYAAIDLSSENSQEDSAVKFELYDLVSKQYQRLREDIIKSVEAKRDGGVKEYTFNGKTVFVNNPEGDVHLSNFQNDYLDE